MAATHGKAVNVKVEKHDGSQERRIVIGMIVDRIVLARISDKWEKELFKSRWANLVGSWCVKFFNKYDKAPGKAIQGVFETWAQDGKDKDTIKLVEKFLDDISGEYATLKKDSNSDYIIDLAAQHFNRVRMTKLAEAIQEDVEAGDLDKAQGRVNTFGRIEMGVGAGVDILTDETAIQESFADKREPLIVYPGALGNFFRDALERDAFVAFTGPEKRGKTWWLLDIAWRGMLQGRKVAFFEVGDMSQAQIMRRFMARASGRPLKATEEEKPVKYPTFCIKEPESDIAQVDFDIRHFNKPLSWQRANQACRDVVNKTKSKTSLLKLSCHPNDTISVHGIQSILQSWERQGWTPDIVVIDYADILAPVAGYAEGRDAINKTWKTLRGMSQSLHCLLVTATQSDAGSYTTEIITQGNFTDDKRKWAHVTAACGINQSDTEKDLQLQRLNWVVLRESEFNVSKCVHVAGCLAIGNPAVKSTF